MCFCACTMTGSVCGKLRCSSLTRGRRPVTQHVRHRHTSARCRSLIASRSFLVLPSTLSLQPALPTSSSLPPPPTSSPKTSRQPCQADSSELRGEWVSLALQSCRTDSISAIWNWARGVGSWEGGGACALIRGRGWVPPTSLIHGAGLSRRTQTRTHTKWKTTWSVRGAHTLSFAEDNGNKQ